MQRDKFSGMVWFFTGLVSAWAVTEAGFKAWIGLPIMLVLWFVTYFMALVLVALGFGMQRELREK